MRDETNAIDDDELHAYADGALPDARRIEIDALMARHPELAERVAHYRSLDALLHERYDRVLDEPIPARLQTALHRDERGLLLHRHRWIALAATLVLGIGIGAGVDSGARRFADGGFALTENGAARFVAAGTGAGFARQAAVAHVVYMPAVDRPPGAAEQDERQFMRWLTDRLGTNIHPPLLSRAGFELTGGRLLPGADGPTALFMYRDQQGERVTLCISHRKPSTPATAFKLYRDGPVNVFYWIDGDFGYAVSGGIDRNVLLGLARTVHAQLAAGTAG
ncbi:transcriptional regulator [Trinickia dabaoshanensis]|uniref:Transcriptional regulator n=1 Tax=Trinickia dabaoshanensis TaxID=564714 RepID=A0A2N7VVH4_9BURK|nr:anti-sigma factor [Trinickia dabaoshanensis]PMS21133.1 transcriptional regulator [Trinickia dabaoshanensis]